MSGIDAKKISPAARIVLAGEMVARASTPASSGGVPPREPSPALGPRSETLRELAAGMAALQCGTVKPVQPGDARPGAAQFRFYASVITFHSDKKGDDFPAKFVHTIIPKWCGKISRQNERPTRRTKSR
jgi:hypothetical protein